MKNLIILLMMLVTLLACSSQIMAPDSGSLDLKVTIGPLCPTEPCNRPLEDIRKVYEAYTFTVKDVKTGKVVIEKNLTYNGTNGVLKNIDMSVGEYELDFTPKTFFSKQGFPRPFTIEKSKITQLEISIDTGIR